MGDRKTNGLDNLAYIDDETSKIKDNIPNEIKKTFSGDERKESIGNGKVQLERRMGLISGIGLIVGTMIGSGIFVSPGAVLRDSQSVATSLIIWAACGLLSLLGSLAYCELGTLIPKSGAEYIYFREAFTPSIEGKSKGIKDTLKLFFGPLPAFLFGWVSVLLLRPSSFAIISLSFASYVVTPLLTAVNACSSEADYNFNKELAEKLIAAACILLISFINCYSVDLATKVQNFFTAAKLVAVAIIFGGGIYSMANGNLEYLSTGFESIDPDQPAITFSNVATAFYSGLWAYDGWNNLNFATEELINPNVNLPRSIIIGLPLVTASYVLVNVAYLAVLSPTEIITSPA
ncbi:hypothetical protein QYM36_001697, partial [Artemia franciscana]